MVNCHFELMTDHFGRQRCRGARLERFQQTCPPWIARPAGREAIEFASEIGEEQEDDT